MGLNATAIAMAMGAHAAVPAALPGSRAHIDDDGRVLHDDDVVELRQYTLQPGARDTLVELFERGLIEPQEAVGMHVIGQFSDLDDPDRFVWLRGFADMDRRAQALQAFYGGPVWQQHRDAANATMVDSDNVLLLRPARPGSGFAPAAQARAAFGGEARAPGVVVAGICSLARPADEGFAEVFERQLRPLLERAGAHVLATYVTESADNTFPRLPVREGERVLVWFAHFDAADAHVRHLATLARDRDWHAAIGEALRDDLLALPTLLRLQSTPRSELR
jgi:hypothetical protein